MAFSASLSMKGDAGIITLAGELDAASAPQFRAEIESAVAQGARKLALEMVDLTYMASAGLRALVFAKQKMGAQSDIYVIGAQASVKETLELTGFASSVIELDRYDAATIEG
jgi:anti-anti-sigma factor